MAGSELSRLLADWETSQSCVLGSSLSVVNTVTGQEDAALLNKAVLTQTRGDLRVTTLVSSLVGCGINIYLFSYGYHKVLIFMTLQQIERENGGREGDKS
jgi:hypothetical protein